MAQVFLRLAYDEEGNSSTVGFGMFLKCGRAMISKYPLIF